MVGGLTPRRAQCRRARCRWSVVAAERGGIGRRGSPATSQTVTLRARVLGGCADLGPAPDGYRSIRVLAACGSATALGYWRLNLLQIFSFSFCLILSLSRQLTDFGLLSRRAGAKFLVENKWDGERLQAGPDAARLSSRPTAAIQALAVVEASGKALM